jgi:CubicO group peptidase (beta-lactamase class C family)
VRLPRRKLAVPVVLNLVGILALPHLFMGFHRCSWGAGGGPFGHLRNRIEGYRVEAGVPSISVAAAKGGRIVWEESFGWADVEKGVEATPHTMYALASTSKTLTATGIMALVERGLVDLDRPVSDYLGDVGLRAYEGDLSGVTLRRIFTHTSGLPRFWRHYYEDELATRPSPRELVRRYGGLVAPPGERFIYSNVGIALAGLVIEEVSGQSYAEFMQSEVFAPLDLGRTAILTAPYDDPGIAQKYEGGKRLPFSDMGIRAAGSAWSSAHDLVRFGMFHLRDHLSEQEAILGDATIEEMYEAVDPRLPDHDFHLPWIEQPQLGFEVFHFGGHVHGGRVSFRLVPSEDIAVVVMSNGEEADTPMVADWVLRRLLPAFSWAGLAREVGARLGRLAAGRGGDEIRPGRWSGEIRTAEVEVPARLELEGERAWLQVEGDSRGGGQRVESEARVSGGNLFAHFAAHVPTADTSRARHRTYLELSLRGDRLSGPVYAESEGFVFCLPFYARLEREGPPQ